MSTPGKTRTLITMDTENARVTRKEAAELAGVAERTINRWAQRGLLKVHRPDGPWGLAYFDAEEVLRVQSRPVVQLELPLPETDIST